MKKRTRKWIWILGIIIGIIFYFWLTTSITIGAPSKYCEIDSDCKPTCFCGCINKNDTCIDDVRGICALPTYECGCVNNRCEEV